MDVDAHSRDRGMHDRDYVVHAGAAAALLAHSPCTTHTTAALDTPLKAKQHRRRSKYSRCLHLRAGPERARHAHTVNEPHMLGRM